MIRERFDHIFSGIRVSLKYYIVILIFVIFYVYLLISFIMPQLAKDQSNMTLLAITYLLYILALGLLIILYRRNAQGKRNIAKPDTGKRVSTGSGPRYIVEFMAKEHRNSVDDLFMQGREKMQECLNGNAENNKDIIDKAFFEYAEAVRLDPQDHIAHNNLGNVYLYKNMPDEAIKEYIETIRLMPASYQTFSNLGVACFLTEKYDDAIIVLCESLKLKPDHLPAHNNLGIVYMQKQLYEQAIMEFESVLKINPENKESRFNLDECLRMKKTDMYESFTGSFP